jgi:hypothetical protein
VWVEKKAEPASAEEQLQAEAEEAAKLAAMAASDASESWQTVSSKPRKAKKVGGSSDASHNEEPEAVRQPGHAASQTKPTAGQGGSGRGRYGHVTHHKRCNDCGKHRDRDGVTIEADPDNEGKGYCLACWEKFLHPPEPLQTKKAAEATPRKHVTHWNR